MNDSTQSDSVKKNDETLKTFNDDSQSSDILANSTDVVDDLSIEQDHVQKELQTEDELQKLRDEKAVLQDTSLRAHAEMENLRRRFEREREETVRFATTNFARDFLSVRDNLLRALDVALPNYEQESDTGRALIEGVQMIEKEFFSILERHHVKEIKPNGEKFDPKFHQAMVEVESKDHVAGTVVQVMQTGYALHDRLLRPALVGVSKS